MRKGPPLLCLSISRHRQVASVARHVAGVEFQQDHAAQFPLLPWREGLEIGHEAEAQFEVRNGHGGSFPGPVDNLFYHRGWGS